jgi:putative ABC transport system permease protein
VGAVKLRALDRKLLRDLRGMRGQAIAIAFVMIAGVTTYVSMISIYDTLEITLERYYRDYRFADGFASVRRAPEQVAERLRLVPGIGEVETRVTAAANLEIPGYPDPVTALIASLPEGGQPVLNRLYVREGRLVRPGREDEVVLNEPFADAHSLAPGDRITAIISGRRRAMTVVGIALSPPYLMQMQPGTVFPDPERFGILWMGRPALSAAYEMTGAFNEVAFTLAPGASIADVTDGVDRVLARFGGTGAYGRADHPSHALLMEEFRQLQGMAAVLPVIFLAVAAFLLNIVVTRLIGHQREQVAVLKAFGYRDRDVGWHYVKLVLVIAVVGAIGGTLLGAWAGRGLGQIYLEYYRFPYLDYTLRPAVLLTAIALTTGAAILGVLRSVRRAVRLPPAEGMRPPPPASYRATVLERLGLARFLDQPSRIILRNLERQPAKAAITVLGIASACAILVSGLFFSDIIDHVIRVQYGLAQREDVTVSFVQPTSMAALYEVRALPGVQHAEPFRFVPVRLRHGHRSYDTGIEGIPAGGYLRRVISTELEPVPIPGEGIVLTTTLAHILGVGPGDELTVEILEGRRRTRAVQVAGLAEQYIGLAAYMELRALNRLAGEAQAISGAYLLIDPLHEPALNDALRDRPGVASIVTQERAISAYMDTAAESILVFMGILSLFAGVIAFGVVYNSMRISLSERDRELASMRVLGFRRGEVAYILLGEMAILVLLAIPVGFALGVGLGTWSLAALETEMFSFPAIFGRSTFGTAALVVLAAATLSALMVRRQLNRLDLIGVLKTRE